jgi:hypothetical protein
VWIAVRDRIIAHFSLDGGNVEDDNDTTRRRSPTTTRILPDDRLRDNVPLRNSSIHPMSNVRHHLPCAIGDYTDLYSSGEHATNVGTMFRGREDALRDNWLHVPIGQSRTREQRVRIGRFSLHRLVVFVDIDDDGATMCGGTMRRCAGGRYDNLAGQVVSDPTNLRAGERVPTDEYINAGSVCKELEVSLRICGISSEVLKIGHDGCMIL